MKVHSEWFWSQRSAQRAAERMIALGYETKVLYTMRANGSHDWLLQVFTA